MFSQLIAFASIALLDTTVLSQEYRYAVFDLGDFGGNAANAFGINDDGVVVGAAWFPDNRTVHPALFTTDGPPVDLGTFGGSEGTCYEINNAGAVTGYAYDEAGNALAFLYADDSMLKLGSLGGTSSIAHAINENDDVIGFSPLPGSGVTHAFVWRDGVIRDLGSLGGESKRSDAWDINESGLIVGDSSPEIYVRSATLWQPDGSIIDLGRLPGGDISEAYAINDLGNIVGWSENANGGKFAVVWDENLRIHNLQTSNPEIGSSVAFGINNKNQVVGYARQSDGMIWEPGRGMQLLKDLVPPHMNLLIEVMHDINEHGQIAGIGEEPYGLHWYRAILLSPVEPELSLSDPVPGRAGRTNTWTVTGARPGSKIIFTYSLQGGGTVVPGCDKLDAVLQINNPKIMKTSIADANGQATIQMYVPPAARNVGDILFQAVSLTDCEESQLSVFSFD